MKISASVLLVAVLVFSPVVLFAQQSIQELGILINNVSFKLPSDLNDSLSVEYSFLNAGCFCSISQATTGKKERMNSINTYSFNLSDLKDGKVIISKPKDSNFKDLNFDVWLIEIGVFDVLVQNTNWQAKQTKTNHFYFSVKGTEVRNRIIELFKKATLDCKGTIAEVTTMEN